MSQETIVAIVVAIIGSGGSGVFVTWILSKVDQRHDPLHESREREKMRSLRRISSCT